MIKLKVEEYCGNCNEFEPNVTGSLKVNNFTEEIIRNTTVTCIHRDRCAGMVKFLEREAKSNE